MSREKKSCRSQKMWQRLSGSVATRRVVFIAANVEQIAALPNLERGMRPVQLIRSDL